MSTEPQKLHSSSIPVEQLRLAPDAYAAVSKRPNKFKFRSLNDLATQNSLEWLIEGHLHQRKLAVLYGAPGSMKTFLALDMALSVATGMPWHGFAVQQGEVLYMTPEGIDGLNVRIRAWHAQHMSTDALHGPAAVADFKVKLLLDTFDLGSGHDVKELLQALSELSEMPKLIVIDTLSRYLPGGDENSQKDMTLVVDALNRMQKATGSAILLVHHSSKHADLERGSNVLRGAADLMMHTQARENMWVSLSCNKDRYGQPFKPVQFMLQPVVNSEATDELRVLIQTRVKMSRQAQGNGGVTPNQQRIIEALSSGPLIQKDICERTGIGKGTVSNNVAKLRKMGRIIHDAITNTYSLPSAEVADDQDVDVQEPVDKTTEVEETEALAVLEEKPTETASVSPDSSDELNPEVTETDSQVKGEVPNLEVDRVGSPMADEVPVCHGKDYLTSLRKDYSPRRLAAG